MNTHVLVVDDDPGVTSLLKRGLTYEGYRVDVASTGKEGLDLAREQPPDLVILDVMMPRMDGWDTCQRMREVSDVPILMLTAKGGETNELRGLRGGADLYVTKPFSVSVLIARVEALLRRSRLAAGVPKPEVVTVADLQVDLAKQEASLAGQTVDLSPTEFRLLAALAAKAGQVLSHRELLSQVWGPEYQEEDLYLKLYIWYLRQKIEKDPSHPRHIITKRGVGYYLTDGKSPEEPKRRKPSAPQTDA